MPNISGTPLLYMHMHVAQYLCNSVSATWNSVTAAWLQGFQLSKHGPVCMYVCLSVCMVCTYVCLCMYVHMYVCKFSVMHIHSHGGYHSALKNSQMYINMHGCTLPYLAVVISDYDNGPLEGLLMHVERWRDVCNEALSTEQSMIGMLLRSRHAWSLNVCVCINHADVTDRHRWVGKHSPLRLADTEPWHKISWNGKV